MVTEPKSNRETHGDLKRLPRSNGILPAEKRCETVQTMPYLTLGSEKTVATQESSFFSKSQEKLRKNYVMGTRMTINSGIAFGGAEEASGGLEAPVLHRKTPTL